LLQIAAGAIIILLFNLALTRQTNEIFKPKLNQPHRAADRGHTCDRLCSRLRNRGEQYKHPDYREPRADNSGFACGTNNDSAGKHRQPGCESFTRRLAFAQGEDGGRKVTK
jgi:hypothetical protein